ncbi:hypothetical protein BLSTO_06571 [Blastocystis sp. subtype 1]
MEQHTEVVKKEEEGAKVEEPVAPLAGNGGQTHAWTSYDSAVAEKGPVFDRKTRFLSATRQMSFLDKAKGLVAKKTELEKTLDQALSNENWGASGTMLNDIAQASYNE